MFFDDRSCDLRVLKLFTEGLQGEKCLEINWAEREKSRENTGRA
jgi:hypothetical protein